MATPEQKAFCALSLRSMNQLFLSSGPSGDNFRVIRHLPTTLDIGISSLCKGKSAGRLRVSEESVEGVRQFFLRILKNCERHASRDLQMSTVTVLKALRKTGNEALSSSFHAVSSSIFVHDVKSK
jgi:hypothetical protein